MVWEIHLNGSDDLVSGNNWLVVSDIMWSNEFFQNSLIQI